MSPRQLTPSVDAAQLAAMSTVAEIKSAIDQRSPQERCELEALLHPWEDDDWDRQMVTDTGPGGKLHRLMEVSLERASGELRDIPPCPPE
jgi:hypothetical protein